MVRAFIEMTLGRWGVAVLEFYEANSLPINTLVVAYGLTLTLSWANLVRIRKWLAATIAYRIYERPDMGPDTKLKRVLREIEIPWEDAVKRRFPLVSKQMGLWPRRTTTEAIQALLPAEELASEALEILSTVASQDQQSKSRPSKSKR